MDEHFTNEEQMLGQVRGILILAKAAQIRKDTRAYFHYLIRANEILKVVSAMRSFCEQRAA